MSGEDEDVEALEADDTEESEGSSDLTKAEVAKARDQAAKYRTRLREAEAKLAKQAQEAASSAKSEVEKAREEGRAEARAEVLKDRALDKVESKAAKLFADPEDARALLASQVDDFIDDGKVDSEAIDKALAELLKRKPHLGADTRRFKGGADGGARGGDGNQNMLTAADIRKLAAEGKHAEIDKARAEGRIDYESARKR
jgi:hypothetical protein